MPAPGVDQPRVSAGLCQQQQSYGPTFSRPGEGNRPLSPPLLRQLVITGSLGCGSNATLKVSTLEMLDKPVLWPHSPPQEGAHRGST